MQDTVLAIDVGGTKLAAALVNGDWAVRGARSVPTPATTDAEALFDTLAGLCGAVLAATPDARPVAIGVGCGGPMNCFAGCVSPLNIPAWRDFPLRDRLAERFGLPTLVDNDAKAYALGEHRVGQGRGARGLLGMVVSTGVGGGIVLDGRLIHGAHGNAGHVGHVIAVPGGRLCACGARGCVEAIASGPSIVRQAAEAIEVGRSTTLRRYPTTPDVATAARSGDALALEIFCDVGLALARGIAAAAALIDLDRVVIGGGVSVAADLFLPALRAELDACARLDFTRGLEVRISRLVVEASLVGAAALTRS